MVAVQRALPVGTVLDTETPNVIHVSDNLKPFVL